MYFVLRKQIREDQRRSNVWAVSWFAISLALPPSLCSRVTVGSSFPLIASTLSHKRLFDISFSRQCDTSILHSTDSNKRSKHSVAGTRSEIAVCLQQSLRLSPSCGVSMMNLIMADEALNII